MGVCGAQRQLRPCRAVPAIPKQSHLCTHFPYKYLGIWEEMRAFAQGQAQLSICLHVTLCLKHCIIRHPGSAHGSPSGLPAGPSQVQQSFLAWGSSMRLSLSDKPLSQCLQPWRSYPAIHIKYTPLTKTLQMLMPNNTR